MCTNGLHDHAKGENMSAHPSRRQIVRSALVSSGLGVAIGYPALTFAQSAAPTPQCHDANEATIRQTEGPYFKPSSPQRADLVEPDTKARLVEINGQVLTRSCHPVERALVDLWHADERGEYDNAGFRYRGHLFTDGEGRYRFRTILPALYPGRTEASGWPDRRSLGSNSMAGGSLRAVAQPDEGLVTPCRVKNRNALRGRLGLRLFASPDRGGISHRADWRARRGNRAGS
jgi:Dioxygenase